MKPKGPILITVVLLFASLAPGSALAQKEQPCWTVAGSTGVLDTDDIGAAVLTGPHMTVSATAALPVIVGARQSITGIMHDTATASYKKTLFVRYRDNGPEARIVVYLKQIALGSGVASDLLVFDSDLYGQSSSFQAATLPGDALCAYGGGFDYNTHIYFVRLEITKSGAGGSPSLHSIRVCAEPCP